MPFQDQQKQAAELQFRTALDHDLSSQLSQDLKSARTAEDLSDALRRAEDRRNADRLIHGWKD